MNSSIDKDSKAAEGFSTILPEVVGSFLNLKAPSGSPTLKIEVSEEGLDSKPRPALSKSSITNKSK